MSKDIWIENAPIENGPPNFPSRPTLFQDEGGLWHRIITTRLELIDFARTHSLEALLTRALDLVGSFVESPIGFYHFVHSDQKTLSLQQWSTQTLETFCQADGKNRHYPIDEAGVWVDCVHRKKAVIHNDYAALPHKKGLPEGHAEVVRELVVPVMRGDRVEAILGVGNKPVDYTQRDVEIVTYLADVTWEIVRQKRAEMALRESEERYRLLFTNADALVSVYDRDGVCQLMNPKVAELFGRSPKACVGKRLTELHDDQGAVYAARIRRVIDSGEPQVHEDAVAFPRGTRWLLSRVHPIPDSDGVYRKAQIISQDITDRKRAEADLQRSNEQLRLALQSASMGTWDWEIGQNRVQWSQETHAIFGVTPSDFGGTYEAYLEFAPREIRADIDRQIQAFLEAPAASNLIHYEHPIFTQDGTAKWIQIRGAIVTGADGAPRRMAGVVTDITDRKAAAEAHAQLEVQLQQAQKLESIGRLAGGVAHDLNNLLSPILGYSELLLSDAQSNELPTESLEGIRNAGIRARDLVRQLLAFSRKQNLAFKPIDLNTMLDNFNSLLRRTIREDIEIHWSPATHLPLIEGDVGQLEQVLMNLAVNAQDAMPQGGHLTIETIAVELDDAYAQSREGVRPGAYVMLMVSDTGRGMTASVRKHIFEPFFTTKPKDKGTGLGLATVYGIVKQHGGNVWVYSEPGLGTTFKVYLPVAPDADSAREQIAPPAEAARGSETILLVEDSELVRKLAHDVLARQGYTLLTAANGKEALRLLATYDGRVDLLLTDVIMPEMNGRQLFERVTAHYPQIKAVYMSGYTDNVIARHGVMEAGIDYLQKPFTIAALAAKVRQVLDT
ncbi:MAG: PAS domain S-box protein [Desulfosarcinaceae bacterium]|nr:PAS domain S-box protein [Desulfosarcinaceae bacterium]